MNELLFPPGFTFGAATAAYQVEGATGEQGRGPSIWDDFCKKRGKIRTGESGEQACEHYYRFQGDIALMQQLGLQAYRFSIAWPRILPRGSGRINQQGLDYYKRFIDALLSAGIEPFITLYHWDMPAALMQRYGGFLNRRAVEDFADYVEVVVRTFGDRVKYWITLNEPWEHGFFGYVMGTHAPGLRRPWNFLSVMHHQLLAHGMAVPRIRSLCPRAKVGISLSLTPIHAHTDSQKDGLAARVCNELLNYVTLDPLLRGHYPDNLLHRLRYFHPKIQADDMQLIAAPLDFIGINHYQREFARFTRLMPFLNSWIVGGGNKPRANDSTAMGWEIYPPGMGEVLTWLRRDYGNPPVYITENGAAFDDVCSGAVVDDLKRQQYLHDYLLQVRRALQEGADVRGYFAWSLLDNFEWAEGYSKRFGLVHVDFDTQVRTIKNSGYWYADVIRKQVREGE